jgi:hypothetical protein
MAADTVALDLFVQDFINTNRLRGVHMDWSLLCARRGSGVPSVFRFESGGREQFAVGQVLTLPDAEWLRIELTHAIPEVAEHRFDYLRMMYPATHTDIVTSIEDGGKVVLVKLTTRHPAFLNLVFVIRDGVGVENPFLV